METNQTWGNAPFNPRPVMPGAPWARPVSQVQEAIPSINVPPLRSNPMGSPFPGMKPTPSQITRQSSVPNMPAENPVYQPPPMSRTEKMEAARINMEERLRQYGFAGFQVVRREFISHSFEPMMTVRQTGVMFNNACISRLENARFIQFLINPEEQKLIIRPCEEGDRDAIRWCITKNDKRRSRQISCREFTERLYELMGWPKEYRYKLQGIGIKYRGERMYLFDLQSKEAFTPAYRDHQTGKTVPSKAVLSEDWKDFGMSVEEHELSTKVDLSVGYVDPDTMGNEQNIDEKAPASLEEKMTETIAVGEANGHE